MPPAPFETFYGTLEDGVSITRSSIKNYVKSAKPIILLFLPLHDIYANPDGSFNAELSEGLVHINMEHNVHLRRRLVELLLESGIID